MLYDAGASWALSWSVRGCWDALQAPPPTSSAADLRAFDGLRVLCMMCVIIEHVCWITTQTYLTDTRRLELTRRAADAMAMANSTLMVQIFFLMSSFLLAHKLLLQRARGQEESAVYTFFDTMLNRIIRYLAADMQLYAVCLVLTLALRRFRRGALVVLTALLAGSILLVGVLAYYWHLVPNYVMHRPESVRVTYRGAASFNMLYQSPLGNAPGALTGVLLAHAHHYIRSSHTRLGDYKVHCAASVGSVLSWRGWAVWARLSFGALLLHMPINKSLVAARLAPSQLDRQSAILEWFGVASVSYLAALPLALLVELPFQRLHRALQRHKKPAVQENGQKTDM
ncbi:Uncharacterized protein OBRU01_10546 [Operophtera brumata]|uniref:Acyltransferase 3 domain-containing protein n=1 Tax=Operophtera brumata TaxID=104452 RepID=A0A0L7LDQ8_OPEBR|nr:Uncharacterized protein OBRU01_10546 [Operophtera brumata]